MTTSEYLAEQAKVYNFSVSQSFDGDYDLRPGIFSSDHYLPSASAPDLIQLAALLQEGEFSLFFAKDNSIHVHAPHRKEHSWGDRGWDCERGLTIKGCEAVHARRQS